MRISTSLLLKILVPTAIVIILIVSLVVIKKTVKKNVYHNRTERCLKPYNDSKKLIKFKKIKKTYYNIFFKKELYYRIKDYYVLSSYKSYMPCGHTNDIVSFNALRDNILLH